MGFDTSFTLGDKDLALCLARTMMLTAGMPMSEVTEILAARLAVDDVTILPASDEPVRTFVQIQDGAWLEFQEYFVRRSHTDPVTALAYHGAADASPAPGVVEAIESADLLVIAPSNPPLSIWPILAIEAIEEAVRSHPRRVAVSPLFSGAALKGPAREVMAGIGLPEGTEGVLEAYRGLIDHLFVDVDDAHDAVLGDRFGVVVHAWNTHLSGADGGTTFASRLVEVTSS